MNPKRTVYLVAFSFLGLLLSTIVHAAIEIPVIDLLISDFNRWGLGLSWEQWFTLHHVGATLLWMAGIWFGYTQGKRWWRVIYIEKKFRKVLTK